ncbi:MAG: hypothetical protein ACE366_14640 [Bradymonadia bacterium]
MTKHKIRWAPALLALAPLFLVLWGCDDTSDAAPADAAPPDAEIADVEPPDAARGPLPPGASCGQTLQCARGECVQGVCTEACETDDDCPELTPACLERADGQWCAGVCEGPGTCPGDQLCAVLGPSLGMCVAPGPGGAGDACTLAADCATWVCAEGQCLGACEAGECPSGQACLPLHTQSVCVAAGDGLAEAPCAVGEDCRSGICRGGRCASACTETERCEDDRRCVVFEQLALCERLCATSADCGESGVCVVSGGRRLCATRGALASGEPCERNLDCESALCDDGLCQQRCDAQTPCPPAETCLVDIAGGRCVDRGPVLVGADCRQDGECETGLCAAGRCMPACAEGSCPEGATCATFLEGAFCYPSCADDDDCPSSAYCSLSFPSGPICLLRGAASAGDVCAFDEQCISGTCLEGRCIAACDDGLCPAGAQCFDFARGPRCAAPEARPAGAACEDEPEACAEGLLCTRGRCAPPCPEGLCPEGLLCRAGQCTPQCEVDLDCRPGFRCQRAQGLPGQCEQPGDVADGEACIDASMCASGLCLDGRCRPRCVADTCEDGQRCVTLGPGAWCLAVGESAPGAVCETGDVCSSGICRGRRCTAPCGDGGACPEMSTCTSVLGGEMCLFGCALGDASCAPEELCAPVSLDGTGVCALPEPEAAPVGAECEAGPDCDASGWVCLDVGDGQGARCRAPCRADTLPCTDGEVCASVFQETPIGACLPQGEGAVMTPCEANSACATGICLTAYAGGRCSQLCSTAPCAEGQRCVNLTRDPLQPFMACAPGCDDTAECPEGLECRRDFTGVGACY